MIVVYDIVHVQSSTWSKSPRSQHNCVAGRTQGSGLTKMLAIARLWTNLPFWDECSCFFRCYPIDPKSNTAGPWEKDAMNNKFVAIELHGSLPNTLIETIIALNCLTVIIRFGFSFSTERQVWQLHLKTKMWQVHMFVKKNNFGTFLP